MRTIAHAHSDFPEKFGIPRQAGLAPALRSQIVFTPEFRNPDAVRGLDGFSHIWLIWEFSEAIREGWAPTVRPPRLGGEVRMGVFATRSPFRPNPLGLSSVRLLGIDWTTRLAPVLQVGGADLMDGTPIFDIKPYVSADLHLDAEFGFTAKNPRSRLEVRIDDELLGQIPPGQRTALLEVLAEDPRPAYQDDPQRIYGMGFAGLNVKFSVADGLLTVIQVDPAR